MKSEPVAQVNASQYTVPPGDTTLARHPAKSAPVAIVGAGCRFPGDVTNFDTFDRLLRDGVDAIREVPSDRWSTLAFASDAPGVPGKTYSRWGGFLTGIDRFEPEAFGISAREAAVMDPQQRLLLEVVWEALEDAAIPLRDLAGTRTGVFVGISTFDYSQLQSSPMSKQSLQPLTALGTSLGIAANRVSYCLDVRGPSFIVDTACSSSLVALDRAVRSLQSGECDTAIVGGVNALLLPEIFISFSAASMLSPDGRCKAFDASANGFVRAEGAAALVLRKRTMAQARGDRIHAFILGSGINQDGRTAGLAMPNGEAQENLLREVYAQSGIDPGSVRYVEAHGTGTAIGDPIEAHAIGRVFGHGRETSRPLIIGSVKTNIGHLEAASGLAGVLKAVLSLKRRTIYRNLHFQQPNPRIPFETLKLHVPIHTVPWPDSRELAIAGVNSFGFGGTNAHVVLAENSPELVKAAKPKASRRAATNPGLSAGQNRGYLLPITARSDAALVEVAAAFRQRLLESDPADLMGFCHTAAVRRTHYGHRLCVTGQTQDELASGLQLFVQDQLSPAVSLGTVRATARPLVFVFSGQGPQHSGMGLDLLHQEPVFRDTVRQCDELIAQRLGWSVLAEIKRAPETSRIDETHIAQPALFMIQAGLAALWQSWGVTPSAVIGHSVGEVAAAWVCGALDLEAACAVVSVRSRAMQDARSGGKMLAAALSPEDSEQRLRRFHGQISLAAVNGPRQVTLSGEPDAVEAIAGELEREGVWHRFLRVSHAFHSSAVDASEEPLRRGLSGLRSTGPRVRWVSTVTGRDVADGDLDADYWWRNVRQPVMLEPAVLAVMRESEPIFLEIGPHPVLSSSLMECARGQQANIDVFASLRRDTPDVTAILGTLGGLFTRGIQLNWDAILPGSGELVDLPPHPWHRQRYWHQNAELGPTLVPHGFHPLLGLRRTSAERTWGQALDPKVFPWLMDHQVTGSAVVPAAAYIELMLAALVDVRSAGARVTEGTSNLSICLDNVQFQRALFLARETCSEMQVTVSSEHHTVSIHSCAGPAHESPWVRNVIADWTTAAVARPGRIDLDVLRSRCGEPVPIREAYAELRSRGLEYGPHFQTCRGLWRGSKEVLGLIATDPSLIGDLSPWWWHPTLLDGCFQICAGAALGTMRDTLMLPVRIDHLRFWDRGGQEAWCHLELKQLTDWGVAGDLRVYDSDGLPLAEILGFHCQRVAGASKSAALRGPQVYTTRWKPMPLEMPGDGNLSTQAGHLNGFHSNGSLPAAPRIRNSHRVSAEDGAVTWIVFADSSGVADAVAARLASRSTAVVQVTPGPLFGGDATHGFQLNPAEPAHMHALLAALPAGTNRVGIVHLWSLEVSAPEVGAEEFDRDMHLAVHSAVWLTQALARQNRFLITKLAFLTRNAQSLDAGNEPCRANATGILGLARVIANEFPGWPIKLVDLSERASPAELDGLAEELLSDDAETESAWRDGHRWVPRLEQGPAVDVHQLLPSEAKAFRLHSGRGGSIDALEWIPAERQPPGPGEVEVHVQHVAINFRDVLKCLRMYPADAPEELMLGDECSGEITAVGPSVSGFQVGDRVVGCAPGCFRSRVNVPATMLLPVSPDWSLSDAATIPIAFLTAWYSLRVVGRLAAGESVLVHAAAGGVGLAAIQIARLVGARVFATAGTDDKRRMLRDLGCELVMDSRSLAFADQIRAHTKGRGVDVILNSLAGEALLQSIGCLASHGRFLELGKRDLFGNSKVGLWPLRLNCSFHAIDLGTVLQEKPALARQLLSELKTALDEGSLRPLPHRVWPGSQVVAAFRTMSQGKHTGKLVVDVRDSELRIITRNIPRVSFHAEGTYIISGGLSGFGLETAKWVARRGGKHLVLISRRSAEAEGVQAALAELRSLGADPLAAACDVGNRQALGAVMRSISSTMPPVRGIFHAAMVLDDVPVLDLNAERLEAVLRPKALGAWNLHAETRDLPLDHFVLFSSVSTSIGNPGQANYAAANAMLEGLAAYRRSLGLAGTAIGWGVVSETGVAAKRPELMKHMARHGFRGSTPAEFLDLLERLLARDDRNAVVGDFDWEAVARSLCKTYPPRGLMTSLLAEFNDGSPGAGDTSHIREELDAATPERRAGLLRDYLQSQVARVLGLTQAKVDMARPIVELGLDSLMGIELAVVLERDLATTLPALAVSPDLTVNRLADDILKQIGSALPDEAERGRVSSAGNREPFRLITPIRAGGSKPPLICFHPIGGGVRVYETLTDALDVSIPVFGVQSRMLAGEDEFSSLAAMAAAYTAAVQVFAPAGPCCLFGYSLGGFLAASVAQRLEAAGRSVEFVGVADGPDCTEQVTTDARHRFARLIASSYQEAAADLPFLKPLDDLDADWTSVRQLAERMLEHREDGAEMFLAWLTDHGRLSGNVAHQTIRAYLQRLAQHLLLIGSSLEAPVIRGSLFVWQATHGLGVGTEVWRRADNLPVSAVLVEADHATLMKPPAVGVIAQQINSAYKAQSSGITVLPGRQ